MELGIRTSEADDFQRTLREVTYADELGIDAAYFSEHAGWDRFWPSVHMVIPALATRTDDIRLGTNVSLLGQKNPVRFAGEINLVDVITEGRFTVGVAAGWLKKEMENLGYDHDLRGPRTTDAMRAMNELWENDVASYDGRFFEFEEFDLQPKAVQDPHPPVHVGGYVDAALKRAAYLGDEWCPLWMHSTEDLEPKFETYAEYLKDIDESLEDRQNPLQRFTWIEEDSQTAYEELFERYQNYIEQLRSRGQSVPDERPTNIEEFKNFADRRFVCGSPEEAVEDLKFFEEKFHCDHVILKTNHEGVDEEQMKHFIDLIADEVKPQL